MGKLIGIDLGGTTAKFGILTETGKIEQHWAIDTNIQEGGKHIVPDIIASINHRLALYQMSPSDFIGIGMGSPGSVDIEKGTVINAFNLNWTSLQEVKAEIEAGTTIPFAIDNDANVAALGERWVGAGENEENVTFITLGTGVGGGIIVNGELVHGVAGAGGEIGHITVDPFGFECTCGKIGCLETVSSATGVVRVARQLAEEFAGDSSLLAAINCGEQVTSKDIFQAAEKEKDAFALKVVDKVCFYLGLSCGNIGNMLNPSTIVIGGGVSAAGEFLRSQVETYFKEYTFATVRDSTKVKLAVLGNDAGIIGAASLALKFKKNEGDNRK